VRESLLLLGVEKDFPWSTLAGCVRWRELFYLHVEYLDLYVEFTACLSLMIVFLVSVSGKLKPRSRCSLMLAQISK
jgi:hypothetical protein